MTECFGKLWSILHNLNRQNLKLSQVLMSLTYLVRLVMDHTLSYQAPIPLGLSPRDSRTVPRLGLDETI